MVTYFHLTKEKPTLPVKKDLLQQSKGLLTMKDIWNSFDENDKPEWLTMDEIEQFEKRMIGR